MESSIIFEIIDFWKIAHEKIGPSFVIYAYLFILIDFLDSG